MEPNFVPGYFKNTTEETKMSNYLKSTRNTTPWPTVELGRVIEQRKEFVTIDDVENYKRCRVQLHAKGIVLRDIVQGYAIKTKTQQVCHADEFLVAEIDAKVGGFGIVPPDLEGAIVSSHYFLFVIDETQLDRQFLDYYLRTHSFQEQVAARGSTNYAAIRPQHVLGYTIPLPPLDEQRRIVARIEALAAKVEAAQRLRQLSMEVAENAIDSCFSQIISEHRQNHDWKFVPISKVAEVNPSRQNWEPSAKSELVTFVPMRAVDDVTGTIRWPEQRTYEEISTGYKWFLEGDVIFARITPCMQNGKSAIAQNLTNGVGFGSTEFIVIRPGATVLAEWLHTVMRLQNFRRDAAEHFKGTAGQQRVPPTFIKNKSIPIPPLPEQHRIVAHLDALQAKIAAVQQQQAATQTRLDALMPSILDRAFRGEL